MLTYKTDELSLDDSIYAFVRDKCLLDSSLICPVTPAFQAYKRYCLKWGFKECKPNTFVSSIQLQPGVEIKVGGKGRLRQCFNGLGILPD